jgi:predicted phage tail protein
METDKVAASGSRTLTQAELSALLNAAIAAKREQEDAVLAPAVSDRDAHWGNTDYGRIAGAGMAFMLLCFGLALLCGGVALILAALR